MLVRGAVTLLEARGFWELGLKIPEDEHRATVRADQPLAFQDSGSIASAKTSMVLCFRLPVHALSQFFLHLPMIQENVGLMTLTVSAVYG